MKTITETKIIIINIVIIIMNEMTGERERAQIDDQRPIILKFILIIDCIIWTHDILINGFLVGNWDFSVGY